MKTKKILAGSIALALLVAGIVGCATEASEQAALTAKARISRADAENTALAKTPGGMVKEGEIEKEHGKLIWSFDIATPGSKNITEVQVDAMSGAVVSVQNESAEDQAKENDEDKKKDKD